MSTRDRTTARGGAVGEPSGEGDDDAPMVQMVPLGSSSRRLGDRRYEGGTKPPLAAARSARRRRKAGSRMARRRALDVAAQRMRVAASSECAAISTSRSSGRGCRGGGDTIVVGPSRAVDARARFSDVAAGLLRPMASPCARFLDRIAWRRTYSLRRTGSLLLRMLQSYRVVLILPPA